MPPGGCIKAVHDGMKKVAGPIHNDISTEKVLKWKIIDKTVP